MVPRSLPTFFSSGPTIRAPRVLEFWSTQAEASRQRFLGAPGSGKTRPGHPAFPRERTPCIALPSASCSSVLWSFFLSVPLSLSQPLRFACPLRFLWSCPSAGLPGSVPFPVCLSFHQGLPWVSAPSVFVFTPHSLSCLPG